MYVNVGNHEIQFCSAICGCTDEYIFAIRLMRTIMLVDITSLEGKRSFCMSQGKYK